MNTIYPVNIVGKHRLPNKAKNNYINNCSTSNSDITDNYVKHIITSLPFFKKGKDVWKVPLSKLIIRLNNTDNNDYLLLAQHLTKICNKEWYTTIELVNMCNSYLNSIRNKI